VAHEVKNPLSAIKSIAQVMREDQSLKGEYSRDLDLIVGETDRLNRSVTQMLSFARSAVTTEASQHALEIVRTLIELFRLEANNRGVRIEFQTGVEKGEYDAGVILDGTRAGALRDALSNLLLNALQATPAGGRVTVAARVNENEFVISVIDGGRGVAPEIRERIWEPFFTTRQRGTGLGLSIVRKRMQEIGGRATLAPTARDQGAHFELCLPLAGAAKS
jgi:signal transduction histidine kinase